MFNPEHLEWFFESVNDWNARRKRIEFRPRLGGADLTSEFFQRRESSDVKPEFHNVNLFNADLKGADMSIFDLHGADLALADLENTRLWYAKLTNVNMARTEPWDASLFLPNDNGTVQGNSEYESVLTDVNKEITSVSRLMNTLRKLNRQQYDKSQITIYFRGESCNEWKLHPSVMRTKTFRNNESEMLIDIMTRRPDSFDIADTTFGRLVIAQHFELPTRLLDITNNPLVALYNATIPHSHSAVNCENWGSIHIFAVPNAIVKTFDSDTISVISNFAMLTRRQKNLLLGRNCVTNSSQYPNAMKQLLHFIRREKPYFENRIEFKDFYKVFVVEPEKRFDRIRAQSGAFLLSAYHEQFDREAIVQVKNTPVFDHYRLKIPYNVKTRLIDELRQIGVSEEILMPGLVETAKAIKRKYIGG